MQKWTTNELHCIVMNNIYANHTVDSKLTIAWYVLGLFGEGSHFLVLFKTCAKVKKTAEISSISWLTQSCHPFSISCMLSFSALAASSFCVLYSLTHWHGYLFRGIRTDYLLAGCFIFADQVVSLQVDNI